MLGWHVSVYRQLNDGASPASFGASHGSRLAVWQTGVSGLDWIDGLVKAGKAIALGGNGYPLEYTATAAALMEALRAGPPGAKHAWTSGPGDVILPGWEGTTVKDSGTMDGCRPDEWLLIQAWDES